MRMILAGAFLAALALAALLSATLTSASSPASTVANVLPDGPSVDNYLVQLAEPQLLVRVDQSPDAAIAAERQRRQAAVAAVLGRLVADGEAGSYTYEGDLAIRATLTAAGADELRRDPRVSTVELAADQESDTSSQTASGPSAVQGVVGSVIFVQAYSPFMWGRASMGGLAVTLTLESSPGVTKGVPVQTFASPPNNYVKIDPGQLYYETVFVDPVAAGHPSVMIAPNDIIHVVTSGDDGQGNFITEDRRVTVDDVQAWTSYELDTVSGLAPANRNMVVTLGSNYLSLGSYLTPGSNVTYAELTASPSGTFSVSTFRTSSDPTYRTKTIQQGSTGFVRVIHSTGDEVYTVHGHNVLVLENSNVLSGWAFSLPSAPSGLAYGITVSRPATTAHFALKDAGGNLKGTDSANGGGLPYSAYFAAPIVGGDWLDVSVNNAPTYTIAIRPITSTVDLAGNQVSGTGPANITVTVGVGRLEGYLAENSYFDALEKRLTTDGAGNFSTGPIQCGTNKYWNLHPGSFGYAGFEEARGNFVYASFAEPTVDVMSGYPFLEGWVANGLVQPNVTVRDAGDNIKSQAGTSQVYIWATNQKLYYNTYFIQTTSQFIDPTDTVTVDYGGGQQAVIPVDLVNAYVNTDSEVIAGQAPVGATVRIIPSSDRSSYKETLVDSSGNYAAGNPFTDFNSNSCSESTVTKTFAPGDSGRAYVTHGDGNRVFVNYGRSMDVNENENVLDLYLFPQQDLDWLNVTTRTVTLVLTRTSGYSATVTAKTSYEDDKGKVTVTITDTNGKVLIRGGDYLRATFVEGPTGVQRPVTLTLNVPLITGTPDEDTDTVAGVGPRTWWGRATLNSPTAEKAIAPRGSAAYPPLQFTNTQGQTIPLVQGSSGKVFFSDNAGHRVWVAWGLTVTPPKLTQPIFAGATTVCGTRAPASTTVRIHDVTAEGQNDIIATGTSDGSGNFCLTVPTLYGGQVLLGEADGIYSQPAVVRWGVVLPFVQKDV